MSWPKGWPPAPLSRRSLRHSAPCAQLNREVPALQCAKVDRLWERVTLCGRIRCPGEPTQREQRADLLPLWRDLANDTEPVGSRPAHGFTSVAFSA